MWVNEVRHLVFSGVLLSLMVISITFFIISSVGSVFCINNSNIPTCYGAMLDSRKVDTVFKICCEHAHLYNCYGGPKVLPDPLPGGQNRAVVRHKPSPKPDLGVKVAPPFIR